MIIEKIKNNYLTLKKGIIMKTTTMLAVVLVYAVGFMSVPGVEAQDPRFETLASIETYESSPLEKSSVVPAEEGSWLKDPITGCRIWNSAPMGNEMISWSGECQDGKASGYGVLVWLEDGKIVGRFKGTMANGKAEGRGKLEFQVEDGFALYDGDFRSSEMHGRGVLLFPDSSRVEGDFRHDNMNGYIEASIADGGSYEGEVKDNLPNGKGHRITPTGEEYYGEFVDGKMEGEGILLLTNGDIYEGEFKDGLADGFGNLSTAVEGLYEGQFKNGLPNGQGVFTSPDGEVARGQFINGEPDGKIVFTLKSGGTKEEMWKNGKKIEQ